MRYDEFEAILKGERLKTKCPDKIKSLVDEMENLSERFEYEKAKKVLDDIKVELKKPRNPECGVLAIYDVDTIRDVHDLVTSHSIRINPNSFKFSDYLGLLVNVHKRKGELKRGRYSDIDRQRKIVAEEMLCLGMTISADRIKRPNRAFLDIAHKVSPFIACKELERREKVMFWKAIETGKKEEIERARERLRKYTGKTE